MKAFQLGAFTSDLPDDQVEDETGYEIIQYAGQGVSRVIAQALRDAGYKVSEPAHLAILGWEFDVVGDQSLCLRLSDLGRFFTLQIIGGSFLAFRPNLRRFQAEVLTAVTDALNRDDRFHDLLWFEEIGGTHGFTSPVVDAPDGQRRRAPNAWDWLSWKEN